MADQRVCAVPGCDKPYYCKGYCQTHARRLRLYGSPTGHSPRTTRYGAPGEWIAEHTSYRGDECLPWPFSRDRRGYGQIRLPDEDRPIKASRAMCIAVHGPQPPDKPHAAHSCGNPECVNPKHLRWASPAENAADKVQHGTSNRGEQSSAAKLNEDQVRSIRALRGALSPPKIAAKFGVAPASIRAIHQGRNWAWLK